MVLCIDFTDAHTEFNTEIQLKYYLHEMRMTTKRLEITDGTIQMEHQIR